MKPLLKALFQGYAAIFFLNGVVPGILLFALTLANPAVAATALIALATAYIFGRILGLTIEALFAPHYVVNVGLTGCCVGFLLPLTWTSAAFAAAAGLLSFMVTLALLHYFTSFFKLPVFSVPFLISAMPVWLIALHSSTFGSSELRPALFTLPELELPSYLGGFLRSMGALIFSPTIAAGTLICVLIVVKSRILFMLAVAGYYAGAFSTALMMVPLDRVFNDIGGFNYALTAMCVGGVFLVPAPRSYLVALAAVILCALIYNAAFVLLSPTGVPVLTLPFNAASLLTICVARIAAFPLLAHQIGSSPEETLENHITAATRFAPNSRTLFLPFSGKWNVWQAFDGAWTHKGKWRHAYDFVIKDELGSTYANDGRSLHDYYCYQKPVMSPVRGRVIQIVDYLPDNVVGTVDRINNWGNSVLLWDERGFYVKISHLSYNSVRVKIGDWVEHGTILGLCGNSGHSPQPHIHIQAQIVPEPDAATLPFSFISYTDGRQFFSNALPDENTNVEPLFPDRGMDLLTAHVLDQEFYFDVLRHGKQAGQLIVTVQMSPDGTYCFASRDAKLYFGKHEGTFYFYRLDGEDPWLAALFAALPRLPLSYRESLIWRDCLPARVALRSWRRHVAGLLSAFNPRLAGVETEQTFMSRYRIRTHTHSKFLRVKHNAEVELHPQSGICRIQTDELELRRVEK